MQAPQPGPLDENGNEVGRSLQLIAGGEAVAAVAAPPSLRSAPLSHAPLRCSSPRPPSHTAAVRIVKLTPVKIYSRSANQMPQSHAGLIGGSVTGNTTGGE